MQGSSRTRGGLVHLLAGAALGAAVVLVVWIFSGGRPFGELVGSSDVSPPTPAAVAPAAPQDRAGAPAGAAARLASEPPEIGRARELRFRKEPAARRAAKAARAKAKARKARRRAAARRKPVVRVVAPPPSGGPGPDAEEVPVAVVPSPAPTAAPAPPAPAGAPAPGGGKPPKRRGPSYTAGAGEG